MKLRNRTEAQIQDSIIRYLREREWFVKSTHGNAYQSGFPDLFASHAVFGMRWIEVKVAEAFEFTKAQLQDYPLFEAHGAKVWIMTDATDEEYRKLFKPSNFQEYLRCALDGCRNIIAWRGGRRS